MKKKGVKRKRSSRKNNMFSKRNIIIILVVLISAYVLVNYVDSSDDDEGLYSIRNTVRNFFINLFGGGGCDDNSDCPNGKFCDGLTSLCSDTDTGYTGIVG